MTDVMSDARNNAKLCAQTIKAELKQRWPTVKFSVRSKTSTHGTTSVVVRWTQGPPNTQVYNIIDKYQHGYFDGETDSYVYRKASTPVSVRYVLAQAMREDARSPSRDRRARKLLQQEQNAPEQ